MSLDSISLLSFGKLCQSCCWCQVALVVVVLVSLKVVYNLLKRPKSVEGDIVFITGAASGIGRQIAINLSKLGAKVVIADIDFTKAQQVAAEILNAKATAIAVQCDVTSVDSIKNAASVVRRLLGNPSILINNAGIVSGKAITELSYESIERTFKVNAISHFYTIKEFLPDMLKANKGHVVTIASAAGLGGASKLTDYCASKYAAVGIDDSLRQELVYMNSKVRTTCICPYYIDTGMFHGVSIPSRLRILKEDYASDRIVQAIIYNEEVVYMPKALYPAMFLKSFLPVRINDWVLGKIGMNSSMDTFKGRN